jgi:hypothetical protein
MYIQKGNKQKNEEKNLIFCCHLESQRRKSRIRIRKSVEGSADSDPYQNITDPQDYLGGVGPVLLHQILQDRLQGCFVLLGHGLFVCLFVYLFLELTGHIYSLLI